MQLSLIKWSKLALYAAVALLPVQLNLILYQSEWGRGFSNPYASIWLSAADVLILFSGLLFFMDVYRKKKNIEVGKPASFFVLLCILISMALSLYFSPYDNSIFHFLLFSKSLSILLFYLLIVNKVLSPQQLLSVFVATMSVQAFIAIFQVLIQGSIGLHMLGEPMLSASTPHLARFDLLGHSLIRAYGTFPHPNVLGGFLVISIFSTLLISPDFKYERLGLGLLQLSALLASFSRSAMLALLLGVVLIAIWYLQEIRKHKKRFIPIVVSLFLMAEWIFLIFARGVNFLKDPGVIERVEGYKLSFEMLKQNPLGIGYNHYTLFMDQWSQTNLMPWEYQPVHNGFMLILIEQGWIGFFLLSILTLYIFSKLYQKRKKLLTRGQRFKKRILMVCFISLFLISLFDHYLITLQQGQYLVVMIFAVASVFSLNPRKVLPIRKGDGLRKILTDRR